MIKLLCMVNFNVIVLFFLSHELKDFIDFLMKEHKKKDQLLRPVFGERLNEILVKSDRALVSGQIFCTLNYEKNGNNYQTYENNLYALKHRIIRCDAIMCKCIIIEKLTIKV
ncbi:hypothetical protein BpHYR1_007839 [Brachionus plicatilis]|uniref:Uncharacterized protein n=1 Tax=Brachionus plicatilis TaxID=10195 RepID=A0A3M7S5D5_BRAPC|nr:hypothetical protein BpHYR1_007839 [Brachionus plicatilis]